MASHSSFSRLLALVLFVSVAGLCSAAPTHFDIAAQPAAAALRLFNVQSATPAVFVYDELKDVRTGHLRGEFEPGDALERLLAGTGFTAKPQGSAGFVVAREQRQNPPPAVDAPPRAAVPASPRAGALSDSAVALQPLVVTARKREERMQDVPASIAAATGQTISDLNLVSVTELDMIAPGLTFVTNPSRFGSGPSIALRGVSTQTQGSGVQDSTSIVIDGVPIERAKAGAFPDLSDIARVEVLRGPQGTLFGKNASAGVISITTMDPTADFESAVTLGYGTHDHKTVRAFLSGPILGERLLGRISFYSKSRDGFVTNVYDGSEWENDDQEGFRGKLLFAPDSDNVFKLSADYIEQENDGGSNIPRGFTSAAPAYVIDGLQSIASRENDRINARSLGHNLQRAGGASLQWDRDLGTHALTALTAYRTYTQDFHAGTYTWLTPLDEGDQFGFTDQSQLSAELRIASSSAARLNYVAGLFLLDNTNETGVRDPSSLVVQTGARRAANQVSWVDTLNYAAFAEANFDLLPSLVLTAGTRWTHEKVDVAITGLPIAPELARFRHPLGTTVDSATEDNVSWRLGTQWKFHPDRMLYVLAATGFKGPGFNVNTSTLGDAQPVDPETSTSFEAGFKSQFWQRRMTWNTSIFRTRFDDFQTQGTFAIPGGTANTIILLNADSLLTQGVEMELAAKLDDATDIGVNASYTDATFRRFTNAPRYPGQPPSPDPAFATVQDLSGHPLPNSPKWAYNLFVIRSFALPSSAWRGQATVDYSWRDEVQWNVLGSPAGIEPSYGLLGASFALRHGDGRFSIKFYGKNLTDKFHTSGIVVGGAVTHFVPPDYRRVFGVEATFRY